MCVALTPPGHVKKKRLGGGAGCQQVEWIYFHTSCWSYFFPLLSYSSSHTISLFFSLARSELLSKWQIIVHHLKQFPFTHFLNLWQFAFLLEILTICRTWAQTVFHLFFCVLSFVFSVCFTQITHADGEKWREKLRMSRGAPSQVFCQEPEKLHTAHTMGNLVKRTHK